MGAPDSEVIGPFWVLVDPAMPANMFAVIAPRPAWVDGEQVRWPTNLTDIAVDGDGRVVSTDGKPLPADIIVRKVAG